MFMHILTVIGARPQFIKAAAVSRAFGKIDKITETIVHTGQHFDQNMSDIFFTELQIPTPFINLQINSGTEARPFPSCLSRPRV
jgi:UDP-GlcNAc3NAcA epimerase